MKAPRVMVAVLAPTLAWARECEPTDSTVGCCLKLFAEQPQRCTGVEELEAQASTRPVLTGAAVALAATAMAVTPGLVPAEKRGVELAADPLRKVEAAIAQCTKDAEEEVNRFVLKGKRPDAALCWESTPHGVKWAIHLGILKHVAAWPCLEKALEKVLPGRFLLEPRFTFDEKLGKWKYLDPETVNRIVNQLGWSGLRGTVAPDIVLLDAEGAIIHVYDIKFPCPYENDGFWGIRVDQDGNRSNQGGVYQRIFGVMPHLVTPREGVIRESGR